MNAVAIAGGRPAEAMTAIVLSLLGLLWATVPAWGHNYGVHPTEMVLVHMAGEGGDNHQIVYENGDRLYRLRWGDAYRDPRVKYGHPQSVHRKRLAVDLILDRWNGLPWTSRYARAGCSATKPISRSRWQSSSAPDNLKSSD